MLREPWQAELLGRTTLRCGEEVYDRFRERKMIALFALLALPDKRAYNRSQLVELLWPDEEPEVSRNRFRVTLHHLRQLLEPAGVETGSVLQTGRSEITLNPTAFSSDVRDFLAALDAAEKCRESGERIPHLEQAVGVYGGEFLPGCEDAWAQTERGLLAGRHFQAVRVLTRDLSVAGDLERGLLYARKAVSLEPLEEEAYLDLMRLHGAMGQPSEALRQYDRLCALLAQELHAKPSVATQKLAAVLQAKLGHDVKPIAPESAASPAASPTSVSPVVLASPVVSSPVTSSPLPAPVHADTRQTVPASAPEPASAPAPGSFPESYMSARRALPARLTRFFGRQEEITSLCGWLARSASTRLVTLLGPGGMGKTRLALETAARLQEEYAGRVYFAAFADAVSARQAGEALQSALRLPPPPNGDALSQAMTALNDAPALLVLDNLEHLLPDMRELVIGLLDGVEGLRCLVTSRRSLAIEGEQEMTLAPLPLPWQQSGREPDERNERKARSGQEAYTAEPQSASNSLDDPENGRWDFALLRRYPSVALFLDRARALRVDYALTERNAADIIWLCRHLEGLPLALELAAARTRVMSVHDMRAQLHEALNWLADTRGGKEMRHQSLRAAIEWSHRLMPPLLRACFHRLSVFVGGFTLEGAGVVCGDMLASESDARALSDELCAASILTAGEDEQSVMRFRMLETLRAFGMEQLQRSGEEPATRLRHLRWLLRCAQAPAVTQDDLYNTLAAEDGSLRAALEHGLRPEASGEEQTLALQLAGALPEYWRARGSLSEGRAFLRRALDLPSPANSLSAPRAGAARLAIAQGDYAEAGAIAQQGFAQAQEEGDTPSIAENLFSLGLVAFHQSDYGAAQTRLKAALALYDSLGNRKRRAECLSSLGAVAWYQGDHAGALAFLEAALAIQRARGSGRGVAGCLLRMGNVVRDRGDLDGGKTLLEQALQTFRALADLNGIATALHDLGLVTLFQGYYEQAEIYLHQSLRYYSECGVQSGRAACLSNLGEIKITHHQWEAGRALTQEAFAIYAQIGDRRHTASTLHNLSVAAEGLGNAGEARRLMQQALELDRAIGNPNGVANTLDRLGLLLLAQDAPQEAGRCFQEALAIGRQTGSRLNIAGTLRNIIFLYEKQGRAEHAARLAGTVLPAVQSLALFAAPDEKRDQERVLSALRKEMGEEAFAARWRQGEARTLEQAAAEIAAQEE